MLPGKLAGAADMNCFPVSLATTSRSVGLIGAFSFSVSTNLKSFPEASSPVGLLGLTVRQTAGHSCQ